MDPNLPIQPTPEHYVGAPVSKPASPNRAILIVLGLLAAAVIGVGGYYLGNKTNSPTPIASQSAIVSAAPIYETGNWETFANSKYGYSIKYPDDWGVSGTGPGQSEEFVRNSWLVGLRGPTDCRKTSKHCGNIDISVTDLNKIESTKPLKEAWLNYKTKYALPDIKSEENINLGGIEALKITYIYNFKGGQVSKSTAPIPFITTVAIQNDKMYIVDIRELLYPPDKETDFENASFQQWQHTSIYDQILATFKLTN